MEDDPEWVEVADQVAYLSRTMDEVLVWMHEAERSGLVPSGLRSRSRDISELNRILAHIMALRETLGLVESNGNMESVRKVLIESLSDMETKAAGLRNRLTHEEA